MSKRATIAVIAVCVAIIILFVFNPFGIALKNSWDGLLRRVDDATNYEKLRQVEDTCRAMIASYEADRLAYEQYAEGEGEELSWAAQARMRANRTASTYNNYILENSYVWSGNVPEDIDTELEYIE